MQRNPNRERMNCVTALIRELSGRKAERQFIGFAAEYCRKFWRKADNSKDSTLRSKRLGKG